MYVQGGEKSVKHLACFKVLHSACTDVKPSYMICTYYKTKTQESVPGNESLEMFRKKKEIKDNIYFKRL